MTRVISVLDIGTSKTTAVTALQEEGQPLRVLGSASLPSSGIKKGTIINIEEVVNVVAQVLTATERMASQTIPAVYMSVSGEYIQCTNQKGTISITNTEITPEDVMRAIEAAKTQLVPYPQNREFIHIIPNEFTIDSQTGIKYPIGMTGSKLEVECHFISVPTSVLQNLSKTVQKLGVAVQDYVFSGWADSFSVLTETEKELGVTLLDIGAGTTDVAIFKEGKIVYTASIPIGGLNITADIAAGLHLASLEHAEKLKLSLKQIFERNPEKPKDSQDKKTPTKPTPSDKLDVSFLEIPDLKTVSRKFLKMIVDARIAEILELVEKGARQFDVSIKSPSGIVVTGGTAKLYGLTNTIKSIVGVPARIGIPKGLTGMIEEITGPEYATVHGLILAAAQSTTGSTELMQTKKGVKIFDKIKEFIKSVF